MSSILNCPTDVAHIILALLSPASLQALCLTHNGLRALAEPYLYSHINWLWDESKTPPIVALLRSILHRPQLASFVKTVTLTGLDFQPGGTFKYGEYSHSSPNIRQAMENIELSVLSECVKRTMSVAAHMEWFIYLCSGVMDAWLALFLSQLPNLMSLSLSPNFTRRTRSLGTMLRLSLCAESRSSYLSTFANLREVSLSYFDIGENSRRDYKDLINTADVLSLFYLPSIERIEAPIDISETFAWPAGHPPNPLSLTSLGVKWIREGQLGQLLSVTKELKALSWQWLYREDLKDLFHTDTIDLNQISADLSQIRNTLTKLTITAKSDLANEALLRPPVHVKGLDCCVFRDFDMLRDLQVPLPFLLGFSSRSSNKKLGDILPVNIKRLTINDDLCPQYEWDWLDVEVLEALRVWWFEDRGWKRTTPRLEVFHLLLEKMDFELYWEPPMRQRLRELGAQAGVRIEITKPNGP